MVRFSVYVVWPSVSSLKNLQVLKIHKTKAVKKICIQEKLYFNKLLYSWVSINRLLNNLALFTTSSLSCVGGVLVVVCLFF